MKHDDLRSIAHNIADSLASGIGLLVGVYEMDIFGESTRSQDGYIIVDFLNGTSVGGTPSNSLKKAIKLYSEALPKLCEKQNASVDFFKSLTARYCVIEGQKHVVILIVDKNGRQSRDEYAGTPLARIKTIDNLGRIRTNRK